jgi:plasmid stability protein
MPKTLSLREIPDEQHYELRIWAAEEGLSINTLILKLVEEAVKGRTKTEKKRLTKRLDDLNQEKLL